MLDSLKNPRFTQGLARWKKRQNSAELQPFRPWVNLEFLSRTSISYGSYLAAKSLWMTFRLSRYFMPFAICAANSKSFEYGMVVGVWELLLLPPKEFLPLLPRCWPDDDVDTPEDEVEGEVEPGAKTVKWDLLIRFPNYNNPYYRYRRNP